MFQISNSVMWARYLRIDFLSHYGNEYYCPVSLLRIYGSTMMEDLLKEQDNGKTTSTESSIVIPSSTTVNQERSSTNSIQTTKPGSEVPKPSSPQEIPSSTTSASEETRPSSTDATTEDPTILPAQDSVFRTILKRLDRLEESWAGASTFLETQRTRIQDVIAELERQQLLQLSNFLAAANVTILEDFEKTVSTTWGGWSNWYRNATTPQYGTRYSPRSTTTSRSWNTLHGIWTP